MQPVVAGFGYKLQPPRFIAAQDWSAIALVTIYIKVLFVIVKILKFYKAFIF